MYDVIEAKRSGLLPYQVVKQAHKIRGSDAIAFLTKNYEDISKRTDLTKDIVRQLSPKQVEDMWLDQQFTKGRLSKLRSLHSKTVRELSRIKEDNEWLRQLYSKRDKIEEARRDEVKQIIKERILKKEPIHAVSAKHINACGVYFLMYKGSCIYIGQSVNIAARIGSHQHDKIFDEVRFVLCPKAELDEKEMFFIRLLKPELNGAYKHKNHEDIYSIAMELAKN